ncbi:unnamed protein product [Didymodactylos carnosus]|uniref:Glutaredoxin n=1 Tax=Didymodactylos carnosus TaxID=1234261 RepID=A0A814T2P1_9BILA|nr:unnamed protein product [Didymodactylos carnosus]CAF1366891.1 unnamed protein product [Didymodactylos carnosus]CAF3916065.1 unnamed protein product [Didymodactylos carnosus]CAF4176266.1 unnamed protein product [Didymodactylos carnosus]
MADKSSAVKDQVEKLIKDNTVMVFSRTTCPYCTKDEIDNGDLYQDVLGKMTNAATVPRVFLAGECIGGGDDTEALEKSGELEKRLKKIDAIQN